MDASELVATTASDLRYLQREWDQEADDDSLRRSSSVLRRLLPYGDYGKAWRELGFHKEPTVQATDLDSHVVGYRAGGITFASAGGATYHGMRVSGAIEANYALTPEEIRRRFEAGPLAAEATLGLTRFVESTSLIIGGQHVKRREVIQYVANRLGGAHFDSKRGGDDAVALLLDSIRNRYAVADKPIVYFELLSIGQALAHSDDTTRFLSAVTALRAAE